MSEAKQLPEIPDRPPERWTREERREIFEAAADIGVSDAFTEHMRTLAHSLEEVDSP